VIHCGVDCSRFTPAEDCPSRNDGFRLVTIGRFVEKKGFDDLLRAVAAIRLRIAQPIRLDIWGDGPLKQRLEDLACELGLRNEVMFRGVVLSHDVPRTLHRYDAFVLPSKTALNGDKEGIPITILEAQAAGLPVVATLHAGIPEGLPPANRDLLAREGDVEDLARKLLLLASRRNQWREIGLGGRRWIEQHFSLSEETRAYQRLFEELVVPCR
jgi:colanic acid/amylovoran biosynthesis glycosyltransferase